MNDITFKMVNITKVYIQFPGSKAMPYNGHIANKGDDFIVNGESYFVKARVFDTNNRSLTIILDKEEINYEL